MRPERLQIVLHILPLRRWLDWRYERTVLDATLRLGPVSIVVTP